MTEKERTRNRLISSHETLLENLRKSKRAQFELRQKKAAELSHALNDKVRITIWPQGNRSVLQSKLDMIFSGTRTRVDAIQKIVETQSSTLERREQNPVQVGEETKYLIPEIPAYLDQVFLAKAIQTEKESVCEDESVLSFRETRNLCFTQENHRSLTCVRDEKAYPQINKPPKKAIRAVKLQKIEISVRKSSNPR